MNKIDDFLSNLQGISATAKIFFLQNLSVMIKTGIPLAEALETLGKQIKNKKLKSIIYHVFESVKKGKTFSESLAPYEQDFGELFINMIKAGETSGNLEEILKKLYEQTKKDHALKTKVRNAMTYPIIIVLAMFGIGAFVVFFVLPNITSLFKELNVQLPLATRVLIGISDFVQNNGLLTATVTIVFLIAFIRIIRTKKGKNILDNIFIHLPVLAPIIKKINLSRISRSLSSLIKTDIAISESILITSKVVGNSLYRQALANASEQVKKEEKLADILRNYPNIFPAIVTQMIAIGEETGALDEVLDNMAKFYEEDVYQTMETLPTIIEPILMILIGIGVAGVAVAILMPMYTLTESL